MGIRVFGCRKGLISSQFLPKALAGGLTQPGSLSNNSARRPKSTIAASNSPENDFIELADVKGPGWKWVLTLANDQLQMITELYQEIGREQGVARVKDARGQTVLIVFNQDDVKHIYQNEGKHVRGTGDIDVLRKFWRGKSDVDDPNIPYKLSGWGEEWRKARDILAPGIYTDAVARYEPLVQEAARGAVDHFEDYADNIADWTKYAALDMFASLALGESPDITNKNCKNPMKEIVALDETAMTLAMRLHFTPWILHPWNGYAKMEASFDRILEITNTEVKRIFDQKDIPTCWFKDLRDEQGIPVDQLVLIMTNLLSASVGTTMGLIQWAIVSLGYHPDCQAKIREEIREVLGGGPFKKSAKMPYLEAFIRESNRLYPSGFLTGLRILDHDIILPNSRVKVPAGTCLQLCPSYETRETSFIPDANEFKPERYFRENIRARKGCPFTSKLDAAVSKDPFGSGARVCLGKRAAELELRTLLCELVKRYNIVLEDPTLPKPALKQATAGVPDPMPRFKITRL